MSLSLALLSACESPKTIITEVNFPSVSSDAEGPYRLSVRTAGVVESLSASWRREAPEGAPEEALSDPTLNRQGLSLGEPARSGDGLSTDEQLWYVEIPGGALVADYHFTLTAEGPQDNDRFPIEGEASFEVRASQGRCSADSECLTGEVCHRLEGYCFSPPSPCTSDVHCERDRFCNLDSGLCKFYDSACEEERDCARGYACVEGLCTLPCDGRCGGGYVCAEDGVSCVAPPCELASDCPASLPMCEAGRCQPAPLTCEPACPSWQVCVAGRCELPPCGSGGACDESLVCLEGACQPCTADGQCGDGRRCDLSQGDELARCVQGERGRLCAPCHEALEGELGCGDTLTCVPTYPGCRLQCDRDNQCPGNSYCEQGGCISFSYEGCAGEQCSRDQDCGFGFVCDAGYCLAGQRCSSDPECGAEMRCGAQGLCTLRAPCDYGFSARCGAGEVCVGGRCEAASDPEPASCLPCYSDLDCGAQEVCAYGYYGSPFCHKLCDTTCFEGEFCEAISELESVCISESYTCDGGFGCGDDSNELNDDPNSATLLSEASLYVDGWVCSSDLDWFVMDNATNEQLFELTVDTDGVVVNFFDEALAPLSFETPRAYEPLPLPPGTRWVEVSAPYVSFDAAYWIEQGAPRFCIDDIFEDNDNPDDAYPIGYGAELSLNLCSQDEDYFVMEVQGGFVTEVTLERLDPSLELWALELASLTDGSSEVALVEAYDAQVSRRFARDDAVIIKVSCLSGCEEGDVSTRYNLSVARDR